MKGLFFNLSLLLSYVDFSAGFGSRSRQGHSKKTKTRTSKNRFGGDFSALTRLDNSCIGKEDGDYWIKFSDEDGNYVPVYLSCSNEYVILDYSKDSNLEKYFSSWQLWHYGTAGPSNSNPVTWEEWFLNGNSESLNANYLVSPDCNICDESSSRQLANTKSTYWLSGNLAKQFWWNFALPGCDMDYETYECYSCIECMDVTLACDAPSMNYARSSNDFDLTGICSTAIRDSSSEVPNDNWREATIADVVYKPSLGIDSRFCVCYKPNENDADDYPLTMKDKKVIKEKEEEDEEDEEDEQGDEDGQDEEEEDPTDKDNIYYLSQKDFNQGPLRIQKSGLYIFTEDVTFDFGAENDYPYFPDISEKEDYPGAGEYRGEWHMGYFAGITIEADDVTIDLGGYELKQSIEFYFQQRFFTHIELSSGQFLPGQGPGFFGADPVFINNFELRNGILGRSSHFGIHGNYPNGFVLKDIHIRHFGTHGIQLNGWENVEMDNIEIGPSSKEEWLLGDYAHARLMVPRLKAMIEEYTIYDGIEDTPPISIPNRYNDNIRGITGNQILSQLEYEMALAYDYAINRYYDRHSDNDYITPDLLENAADNEHWIAAKEQFIWEDGLPSATSIHGIFLNTHSVSVATFTFSSSKASHGAKLNNIHIHDLYHSFHENVRLAMENALSGAAVTPWNSMWSGRGALGNDENLYKYYNILLNNYENGLTEDDDDYDDSWKDFEYIGNVLTNSYAAMYELSESWEYNGLLTMEPSFYNWVFDKIDSDDDIQKLNFGCNADVMQHSGKGLLGLRMDAVYDVSISNVYVYNLYSKTSLGATFCGEYDGNALGSDDAPGSGGHFRQVTPQQSGFSGNMIQGVSITGSYDIEFSNDIIISNFRSDYGEIFGFSIWPNTNVNIKQGSNMIISNFISGIELTDDIIEEYDMTWESRPNRLPESCGIRVENKDPNDYSASTMSNSNLTFENGVDSSYVITCDMTGYEYCVGDELNGYTLYGDYYEKSNMCNDILTNVVDATFLQELIVNGYDNGENNINLVAIGDDADENMIVMFIIVIVIVIFYICLKQQGTMTIPEINIPQRKITTRYGSTTV